MCVLEDTGMAVVFGLSFMLAGVFSAFCAAKDYAWFMESRKARQLAGIFGRKAARIFYIVLGVLLGGYGCIVLLTIHRG
jgi:hypothetical protein